MLDKELIFKCVEGDREAQTIFVETYSNLVFRTVQYTLKFKKLAYSRRDVDDLHNTIFEKMFENRCKKLSLFKGKNGCSLRSWVRLIAGSIVLDHTRKIQNDPTDDRKNAVPLEAIYDMASNTPSAQRLLEQQERAQTIRHAMEQLAPRDRLFLTLHFIDELPIHEVARAIGVTENTAHQIKHRAIHRLKELMANAFPGGPSFQDFQKKSSHPV